MQPTDLRRSVASETPCARRRMIRPINSRAPCSKDSMSSPSQTRTDPGRREAIWLVAPSLLVAVATVLLLPWLLETRQRLDNAYWEGQLHFAAISLGVAAAGVPFVILRLLRRVPFVCHLGWLVVATGYLAMTLYMLQSHFPGVSQFLLGSLGVAGLLIAIRGLIADFRHTDSPS